MVCLKNLKILLTEKVANTDMNIGEKSCDCLIVVKSFLKISTSYLTFSRNEV
jgi:hypothetical protein